MIYLKTYTLKEVSKIINVAPGTLRQWEADFGGILHIPRSKQGARIFTEIEISLLLEIKRMSTQKVGKETIRQSMHRELEPVSEEIAKTSGVTLEIITETPVTPSTIDVDTLKNAEQFFEAMETYKKNFLNEVKDEIRDVVRKEVLNEVKKEIKKGTYYTVKSLSNYIYKSTANTNAEIQELSETLEKSSELTADSLKYLSNSITNVSIETSEEVYTLSKQLSETTEDLSHYVDATNNEISSLTEAISKERQFFVEERNEYRHEISQRELAFQQMLTSYRDVAAAKDKKWWKFWD
jgi:DNA-binding transcriptional MerR regulator